MCTAVKEALTPRNGTFPMNIPGRQKMFKRLVGCWIKSMRPIFKTEMFIYQSKANLDESVLFGQITHL